MKMLFLNLRRISRSRSFLILILVCALTVYMASLSGAAGSPPPAGVCDLGGSAESQRIKHYLKENGYIEFAEPAEMEQMVQRGELDCCAVLPEDLDALIKSGDMSEAVRFVSAPSSFHPELYQNMLSAALFRECAPYITAKSFEGTDVTEAQVLESYEAMFSEGYVFAFDIVSADGAAIPENIASRALVTGAAAILIMLVMLSAAAEAVNAPLVNRLGFVLYLKKVMLPELLIRALLCATAFSLALLAAGRGEGNAYCNDLLLPVFVFSLLMTGLGLVIAVILPEKRQLYILLPLLLIAALALCPIYVDVELISPALAAVRRMVPAYWMWLVIEKPLPAALAAAALFALSVTVFALRSCLAGKHKIRIK